MGMKSTRMSRKNHPMPRVGHEQRDISGLRGTGTRNVKVDPNVGSDLMPSNQYRAFDSTKGKYPLTPQPKSAEHPTNGHKEGMVRGRQADKPSKHK